MAKYGEKYKSSRVHVNIDEENAYVECEIDINYELKIFTKDVKVARVQAERLVSAIERLIEEESK